MVLLAGTFMTLALLHTALVSFEMTPAQQDEAYFGQAASSIGVSVDRKSFSVGAFPQVSQQIRESGDWWELVSLDLRPDKLPSEFSTGGAGVVQFTESSDMDKTLDSRNPLISGRIPSRVGEVAISSQLADDLGHPTSVSVAGGALMLRVVGEFRPVFGSTTWNLVAPQGTWDSIPQSATRKLSRLGATFVIFSSSRELDARMRTWASELNAPNRQPDDVGEVALDERVRGTLRPQASALLDRVSFAYKFPAIAVAVAVGLLIVRLNWRRLVRIQSVLLGQGVARARVVGWQVLALAAASVVAVVFGCVAGRLLGLLARTTIISHLNPSPLPPAPILQGLVPSILVCLGSMWLVALLSLAWRAEAAGLFGRILEAVPWRLLRYLVVALLTWRAGTLMVAGSLSRETMSLLVGCFTLGLVLLIPDMVRLIVGRLPTTRSRALGSRRFAESEHVSLALGATVTGLCVAATIAMGTFTASTLATEARGTVSAVPAGQLQISGELSPKAQTDIAGVVSKLPDMGEMVRLRTGETATLDRRTVREGGGSSFGLLVVDNAAVLGELIGPGALSPEAARVFDNGGIVDWSGVPGPQALRVESEDQPVKTVDLPTAKVIPDPSFQIMYGGAVRTSTLAQLKAPTFPVGYAFIGVPDGAGERAQRAILDAGYPPQAIAYNKPPPEIRASPQWYATLAGLAALTALAIWLVMRQQVRMLRGHAAKLLAVGLTLSWSRSVLLRLAGLVVVSGVSVGLVAGILPIGLLAYFSELVLAVPVTLVAGGLLGVGFALFVSVGCSLLTLRPVDRF